MEWSCRKILRRQLDTLEVSVLFFFLYSSTEAHDGVNLVISVPSAISATYSNFIIRELAYLPSVLPHIEM